MNRIIVILSTVLALMGMPTQTGQAQPERGMGPGKGPGMMKRQMQDKVGGVPEAILKKQTLAEVSPPSMGEAIAMALKAADEAAGPLIDTDFHKGATITVPGARFKTHPGSH